MYPSRPKYSEPPTGNLTFVLYPHAVLMLSILRRSEGVADPAHVVLFSSCSSNECMTSMGHVGSGNTIETSSSLRAQISVLPLSVISSDGPCVMRRYSCMIDAATDRPQLRCDVARLDKAC